MNYFHQAALNLLLLVICLNVTYAQTDLDSNIITQESVSLSLDITTSRTIGVAPLYVFFEGIDSQGLDGTNDLSIADFDWNFDVNNTDPNGNWERTKGMVAGHVFEEPGTYLVSCTLTAPDGSMDTENVSITVEAFSGITYYVSNDGKDGNDGLSEVSPLATVSEAQNVVASNVRILFKRGHSFSIPDNQDFVIENQNEGPIILGAYGKGQAPIITGNRNIIEVLNADHVSVADLHLIATGSNTTCLTIDESHHVVAIRLEMEGSTIQAVRGDNAGEYGIFDSYIHDFGVLGIFTNDGTRFSWVGNTMNNLIGTPQEEHGMRVQRGEKQFIAHNILSNLIDTKSAIQIRGDNQRYVMLYRNRMDRILGINPTNSNEIQAIYHVTVEGNYIGQNPDYVGSLREPDNNGLNIEANRVAVRNNVIDGYTNAINVGSDRVEVIAENVAIYHNTVNWREVSPQSLPNGKIARIGSTNGTVHAATITAANNLITAAENVPVPETVPNDEAITWNNLVILGESYQTDLPESSAHENNAINYLISETSAARYMGAHDVPVYFDFTGASLLSEDEEYPDIGAFQYTTTPLAIEEPQLPNSGSGVELSIPLAADDQYSTSPILVYPNPFSSQIKIEEYGLDAFNSLEIYTEEGHLIISQDLQSDKSLHSLELIHLSDGIYFLALLGDLPEDTQVIKILKE